MLGAIGPYWDGNEVWLLASGGALFVAFPKALASGLSGFYFAIFLVLWALILRGISIEFRSHVEASLWRGFWDVVFSLASAALAILFGAALGNLIRGLPLDGQGWFTLPLFTSFTPHPPVGIPDWYHGAHGRLRAGGARRARAAFLAWKTDGELQMRARSWAFRRLRRAGGAVAGSRPPRVSPHRDSSPRSRRDRRRGWARPWRLPEWLGRSCPTDAAPIATRSWLRARSSPA